MYPIGLGGGGGETHFFVSVQQRRANIDFSTEYEYEYIRKVEFPIFVFEYPVFGDKYSNIQIYSDIRPLQKTIFDRI